MNQQQDSQTQALSQAAQGLLSTGQGRKLGMLQEVIERLQKQNQEMCQCILSQRDAALKVTGVNPVEEPEVAGEAPEPSGDLAELDRAVIYHNELLSKIRSLTNHWQTL